MAEMRHVVGRDAADVHAYVADHRERPAGEVQRHRRTGQSGRSHTLHPASLWWDRPMARFVAFLRAVNVVPRRAVAMAAARDVLDGVGFEDVDSFANTGNLIFSATGRDGGPRAADPWRDGGRVRVRADDVRPDGEAGARPRHRAAVREDRAGPHLLRAAHADAADGEGEARGRGAVQRSRRGRRARPRRALVDPREVDRRPRSGPGAGWRRCPTTRRPHGT